MSNIGSGTSIRLGLVITILGLCLGGLCIGFWSAGRWAGKIDTRLSSIESLLSNIVIRDQSQSAVIDDHAARIKSLETSGSSKAIALEKEVAEIKHMLEIHTILNGYRLTNKPSP